MDVRWGCAFMVYLLSLPSAALLHSSPHSAHTDPANQRDIYTWKDFFRVFLQILMRLHEAAFFLCFSPPRGSKTQAFSNILLLHYVWLGVINVEYLRKICVYLFISSLLIFPLNFLFSLDIFSPFLQTRHLDKLVSEDDFQLSWKEITSKPLKSYKSTLSFNFFCLARNNISLLQVFRVWKHIWTHFSSKPL